MQESTGGITTPGSSHLQYYADGSYPALGPQIQMSTVHEFQQAEVSNQFHHGLFLAQNVPQGPTLSQTTLYPTSFNSTTSWANFVHDYCDPQHAASSLHESEYSNYQTMHSQDPMGISHPIQQFKPQSSMVGSYQQSMSVSHPIPQFKPQSSTVGSYQQSMGQDFRGSSVPHHTPQFPTALNLTDPSMSQAAPTQSTWPAFDAHRSHDQGCSHSKNLIKCLSRKGRCTRRLNAYTKK
jgi:hypothetical protein